MQKRVLESRESLIYCDDVMGWGTQPPASSSDRVDNLEGRLVSSDKGIKKLPSPGNGLEEYFRDNSILYYKEN